MTAEEKYSESANIKRRGGHDRRIGDSFDAKDENSEEQKNIEENQEETPSPGPGMVFNNRNHGPAGIGKMSEYAMTGIYIDPNQITKKSKQKKKNTGRDIKYALKDLEAASFMGMDDFMGGSLAIGAKKSKINHAEEQFDDKITEDELA